METFNELLSHAPSRPRRSLYLTQGAPFEHFDAVQIRFGFVLTGIVSRSSSGYSQGIERGPTLVFGQSESGLIGVSRCTAATTLPDERRGEAAEEFVEAFDPEAITRAIVLQVAADFFDWARSATLAGGTSGKKRPIGFLPDLPPPPAEEPG